MKITSSDFQRIYDPSVGETEPWYINDHCFIQDDSGLWHMFGITHAEPMNPLDVKFFAHATSKDLMAPQWTKQAHAMHIDVEHWQEAHCWAPHIIKHDGLYYMFYCAGGVDATPFDVDGTRYRIHLATGRDLYHWERHEANPMVVDGFAGRDPMVLRHGDQWIMYYTATSKPEGGSYVVAAVTSKDLVHWADKRVVFTSQYQGTAGGDTESPFVIHKDGKFYLSVCTNIPYNNTAIYESDDPFAWDAANRVGDIPAHAAEIIHTADDQWYISRCGWEQGGLYLAKLFWEK